MNQAVELPNSLSGAIKSKSESARRSGVLQPLKTKSELLVDQNVEFKARRIVGPAQALTAPQYGDPFLAPHPELFVGDISHTHYCSLEQHPIVEQHLLIATRQFESQETLLRMRDFVALCTCMRDVDGVGLYDAGRTAGSVQAHKRLQLLPLHTDDNRTAIPMMSLLGAVNGVGARIRNVHGLPFGHAFAWLTDTLFEQPLRAGEVTYDLYVDMMEALGVRGSRTDGEFRQPVAYNLILTRHWLLLVPRNCESYQGLTVNAYCYTGSFLIQSQETLDVLRDVGPMTALSAVARQRV